MALWHLNSARFKIWTIKLILILYHISCYFHVKNGENVYICHVKMIMKRQKLEKDVKINRHLIVYTNTIILVQHLDNQGSIKFFISELILQWHFELTGHLSIKWCTRIPTLEWNIFSFTVLKMTRKIVLGKVRRICLMNEFFFLDLAFLRDWQVQFFQLQLMLLRFVIIPTWVKVAKLINH